jgi:predicted ATPase
MGFTLLFMGETRRAMERVEQALQLYDPVRHRRLALRYGEDPGVVSRLYGAIAAWLLGQPTRARALVNEGLRLARDLAYPAGITQALWYSAVVYQLCGDVDRVRSITERVLHDHDGVELPLWSMLGVVLNGWALAQGDELEKGIEQMQKGMARLAADGVGLIRPYHASLLAGALSRLGDAATAHLTVTEALETARRTGERWFEAELLRQHAELIRSSDPDSAQAALHEALDVARRQQVRSLELRVALSLADCSEEPVGDQDGHARLARILDSFTEGHDTVDLTRAAAALSGTT